MGAGISITVDLADFGHVERVVSGLAAFEPEALMTAIGAMGESQTRRRITDEKTGPDGQAWPPNRAGTSILLQSGEHLLSSLAWTAAGDEAEWGAAWEFAHVHQEGMTITPKNGGALKFWFVQHGHTNFVVARKVTIPARPFVGISDANAQEMRDLITDVFGALLQ